MDRKELEQKTRKIFHGIHRMQGEDKQIYHRLHTLLSTEYLKVDKDFFRGKTCLDAGCGSNANATYNMLELGAQKVYAFDLDKSIFEMAPRCLKKFEGRYELRTGNVLQIDFPDNTFDFVHCAGVLHHTHDVYAGLKELARVTQPGGTLYFDIYGKGGLVRDMTTFLREKYAGDKAFHSMVDNLDEDQLRDCIRWILAVMQEKGDELADKVPGELIEILFDRDLVLTIKDRIQAPVYHENSEEELVDWLKRNGFKNITRLTKYPRYKNVRRFLSPLYERFDNKYARLFYGSGQVQLKATKS